MNKPDAVVLQILQYAGKSMSDFPRPRNPCLTARQTIVIADFICKLLAVQDEKDNKIAELTRERDDARAYVQSSDGPVRAVELVMLDNKWYAPSAAITIISPSAEDKQAQLRLDKLHEVQAKARAAGLTADEIALLTSAPAIMVSRG